MRRVITVTLALVLTLIVVAVSQPARLLAARETSTLAPWRRQDLSLEQAQAVVSAALAAAEEQGTKMDIAVVDAGGNLKAFARMDGAWLGSIDIATTKAAPPATSTCRPRSWASSRSQEARSTDRGLQRRLDHVPRRATTQGRRRDGDRRHRRLRLDGRERPSRSGSRGGGAGRSQCRPAEHAAGLLRREVRRGSHCGRCH